MDKRFLAILGVIAAIFIGIFVISSGSNNQNGNTNNKSSAQATNHIFGKGKKGVTLIEYGDYQCPVCLAYEPVVAQIRQKYADDIFFQFRNLPLVSKHPNAFAAARAAEAASLQNKFWQMHDQLYANWDSWTNSNNPLGLFKTYAQGIGLNIDRFAADYASSQVNDAINADLAAFQKTGQSEATPTFFLDGRVLDNTQLAVADNSGQINVSATVNKFAKVIDDEITQKQNKQ